MENPTYGSAQQFTILDDTSDQLQATSIKLVMQIIDSLLYYAIALDNTLLVVLNEVSVVQAQPMVATWNAIVWFLNYCATRPSAEIKYEASDMCFHTYSDASYLSAPKDRSQMGAHIFLSNCPKPPPPHTKYKLKG